MREGNGETNPVRFVASLSCCLIPLLSRIFRGLLRRLGSLVHLVLGHFRGVLSRVGRLAFGRTETMFGGVHHPLATIDSASKTFSDRFVDL